MTRSGATLSIFLNWGFNVCERFRPSSLFQNMLDQGIWTEFCHDANPKITLTYKKHLFLAQTVSTVGHYGSAPPHLLSRAVAEGMILFRDIPTFVVQTKENIMLWLLKPIIHSSHSSTHNLCSGTFSLSN